MPSHLPCCSRVNVQEVQRLVELNLQYVGMPGYEELWWRGIQLSDDAAVIITWVASNVLHQDINVLTLPSEHFGKHSSQVTSIAIATYSPQGSHITQFVGNFRGADVTSMPYLVTVLEKLKDLWI